jgi:hypothetical protein
MKVAVSGYRAMQRYHFFDPYEKDRERAACERAEWHKAHRLKGGPRQGVPTWRGGLAGRAQRPVTLAKVSAGDS